MTPQQINELIKAHNVDTNQVSDGYHTFGELYEHRCVLWVYACKLQHDIAYIQFGDFASPIWRSKKHSDGSEWEECFVLGMGYRWGEQITYHLPMKYWERCGFAETLDKAPEFDGHTSDDVLKRLLP